MKNRLRAELPGITYEVDEQGHRKVIPKNKIRATLGYSPDCSDSLALCVCNSYGANRQVERVRLERDNIVECMRSGRAYTPRQRMTGDYSSVIESVQVIPHRGGVIDRHRGIRECDPNRQDRQAFRPDYTGFGAGGGCF